MAPPRRSSIPSDLDDPRRALPCHNSFDRTIPAEAGYRLGEVREHSYEDQRYRASGLNLVVAGIVLWNTVYLEHAVEKLHALKLRFLEERATHLSPLAWSHISLTGDYIWPTDRGVKPDHQTDTRITRFSTQPSAYNFGRIGE
ncbi:MAG: Tn3 family transposase (plasmid) [Nitrospira sp.]